MLGNYMNADGQRGGAPGFRISSVNKLTDTKSADNQMTLLHYIVQLVEAKVPEALNLKQQLADLAEEAEAEDFDRVIAVNLKGTMLCGKHAARRMIGHGGGRVVNIASQAALLSLPRQSLYTASKGGVVALTRSQAIDWAEHGINVNCICPTFIRTPMAQPMLDDPAVMRAVTRRIPLGRVGEPRDIAATALFLISEMSSLMTGQTLAVDGGWSAGEPALPL